MKFKLLLATLTLVLSTGAMAESAKDAIKAAKAAQKEASSLGFEWRDMGKTIKKAEAAAKDGKDKKAIKLANKITGQMDAIRAQAELAKTAGPTF
ncbi:MAG: hypothetical protein V7749_03010 [Cocleimonas sp.]